MKILISPLELRPGDVYQDKRVVYVARMGDHIIVDYKEGSGIFSVHGLIEVDRSVERIEG